MPVQLVGDILSSELSHMQAYIRFCSCQLNAAALLQQKTDKSPDFKLFLKVQKMEFTSVLSRNRKTVQVFTVRSTAFRQG